jgi:hypothetical protein
MERIYLDTNQLYYIRRIADEADGWDYGNYEWAFELFPDNPELVDDIRALCFIVALQYEWELDFLPSNASFAELSLSSGTRARATRDAWVLFAEGLKDARVIQRVPCDPTQRRSGTLSVDFVEDPDDRVIIRDALAEGADVLLTSDNGILQHQVKLSEMNIRVMRPKEWLDQWLAHVRGSEDSVAWLERILFTVGGGV